MLDQNFASMVAGYVSNRYGCNPPKVQVTSKAPNIGVYNAGSDTIILNPNANIHVLLHEVKHSLDRKLGHNTMSKHVEDEAHKFAFDEAKKLGVKIEPYMQNGNGNTKALGIAQNYSNSTSTSNLSYDSYVSKSRPIPQLVRVSHPPPSDQPGKLEFELVLDKRGSDYNTYRGPAVEFTTEWTSVLDFMFDTSKFVTGLLLTITVAFKQVKPLQVLVWKQYETYYGIPYWHYRMKIYAHDSPIDPATVASILFIIKVAVVAIAAWILLNSATTLVWGPPGVPEWSRMLIPASIAVIGIAYAISVIRKK